MEYPARDFNSAITLYKSKVLRDGRHPVMLRINCRGKRKMISTGVNCKPEEWDFKRNEPKKSLRHHIEMKLTLRKKLDDVEAILAKAAMEREMLTFDKILHRLGKITLKPVHHIGIIEFYNERINKLKSINKIGNAESYIVARNSFRMFLDGEDMPLKDLSFKVLSEYEDFLRKRKIKETTMSSYFRTHRALYRRAINEELIHVEKDVFQKFKISKFNVETRKRALTREQFERIIRLDLYGEDKLDFARDIFLWSVYAQGMNFADIATLRWVDVYEGRIEYVRQKTHKLRTMPISTKMEHILRKYKPLYKFDPKSYVFPILDKDFHIDQTQIFNRTKKVRKQVNDNLKEIGYRAELDIPLTTYVARHTFATLLKRNNVAISMISDMLGHRTEEVTQIYLGEFEDAHVREAMEML